MSAEPQAPDTPSAEGAGANAGEGRAQPGVRVLALRYGWLIIVAATAFIVVFGVAIDLVMSAALPAKTWQNWSNVGQAFEAVAAVFAAFGFAALVITFLMQYKELQLQRQELALQRHAMSQTQAELHRSAEADLRRLHVELLRMAINDEGLAEVWPDPDLHPHEVRRQFWYANLVYQHQRLAVELGEFSEEAIALILRRLFRNPIMRAYWKVASEARAADFIPGTKEWRFAQMTDAICREYDDNDDPPDRGLRLVE
jgi:hypothetical protein